MKHNHAAKEPEKHKSAAMSGRAEEAATPDLQAEFNNYRRRADADVATALERGREKAIRELLPVLDSFALAKAHAKAPAPAAENPHKAAAVTEESELSKGFTLIYSQLHKLLDEWQVSEIPGTGLVDTRLHEVYITETLPNKPAGTILQVLQPGYVRNGTVLRTAKVKAARN